MSHEKTAPIKDVTPGSQIIYNRVKAWVVGATSTGYFLIGWKAGENSGNMGWHAADRGGKEQELLSKYNCLLGWVLGIDDLVILVSKPHSGGLACRLCREFFPMAVPNRPDGISLICYGCRQGWIPAGM